MKHARITLLVAVLCIAGSLCPAVDYSMRKTENQVDSVNSLSRQIVDVDCAREDGRFVVKSLPSVVPGLFTVRFTAPADHQAGDTIVVKGRELQVRTPDMTAAASGIFRGGAVIHCDIDMDRELAFVSNGGETGEAQCPFQKSDLVYFIDPNGNNSFSTPGTEDAPFASLNGALTIVSQRIIPTLAGSITFKIKPGDYPAEAMEIYVGMWAAGKVFIEASDPENRPIVRATGRLIITGGDLTCKNINFITDAGMRVYTVNMELDSCSITALESTNDILHATQSSFVVIRSFIEVDGSSLPHRGLLAASGFSTLYAGYDAIRFVNTPEVTLAGILGSWKSNICAVGSVTGSFKGKRYHMELDSLLNTQNKLNSLPGTAAGVVYSGGSAY